MVITRDECAAAHFPNSSFSISCANSQVAIASVEPGNNAVWWYDSLDSSASNSNCSDSPLSGFLSCLGQHGKSFLHNATDSCVAVAQDTMQMIALLCVNMPETISGLQTMFAEHFNPSNSTTDSPNGTTMAANYASITHTLDGTASAPHHGGLTVNSVALIIGYLVFAAIVFSIAVAAGNILGKRGCKPSEGKKKSRRRGKFKKVGSDDK
eukprot:GHVT01024268.1.p1 GENE.GHVT01024268.1~~GHVT01024268.1.p1  ORF type:complete len:210 (-),score=13.02 GHVT01024268.1:290-919(-)